MGHAVMCVEVRGRKSAGKPGLESHNTATAQAGQAVGLAFRAVGGALFGYGRLPLGLLALRPAFASIVGPAIAFQACFRVDAEVALDDSGFAHRYELMTVL